MFIDFNLETINQFLCKLEKDTKPLWGTMTSSEVVVHLRDTLRISNNKTKTSVLTPTEKLPLYKGFLKSDQEMPKGYKVDFLVVDPSSNEINLATLIEDHNEELNEFINQKSNPNYKTTHPIYGELDYEYSVLLHTKHYTHHLKQFGLLKD